LNGASQSSACIVNLDATPDKELVFGDQSGKIHAVKSDGTELPGFPYIAAGAILGSTAMADINGDGHQEIVANLNNSTIICVSHTGQLLWSAPSGGTLVGNPIIANLNMSGPPEIVAFAQSGSIIALTSTGTAVSIEDRLGLRVPISTTSSRATPSVSDTITFCSEVTIISVVLYPIEDTTMVTGKLETFKLKLPSKSVIVPVEVPLTITFAPGIGSLVLVSITDPDTVA